MWMSSLEETDRWAELVELYGRPAKTREALDLAMRAAVERGESIPCGSAGWDWMSERMVDQQRSAAACAACPVRGDCAVVAYEVRPSCGVWAGMLWRRGRVICSA